MLDEAHLLEKEALEEFRFLLNFSYDSVSPMALVLSGQTELLDKLRMRRYDALRQRIDIFCSLPHLDRSNNSLLKSEIFLLSEYMIPDFEKYYNKQPSPSGPFRDRGIYSKPLKVCRLHERTVHGQGNR